MTKIINLENRLSLASGLLESYHYKKVLKRGYAIVRNEQNKVIFDVQNVVNNQKINVEFDNGNFDAIVNKIE